MAGEKQADEILMYWRLIVGGYTIHFLKANPDQLVIPVPAVAIASRGEAGWRVALSPG